MPQLTCPHVRQDGTACNYTWPSRVKLPKLPVECPNCRYRPDPARGRAGWTVETPKPKEE